MSMVLAQVGTAGDSMTLMSIISPYFGVFFVAFFVSIVATPIMRRLAIANGIVDIPDLKRKNHIAPVAYLGGIGILLGWLAGVTVGYVTAPHNSSIVGLQHVVFPFTVILGAGAIVITGLIDDIYGISPRVKVGGQFFAAAALAGQDVGIRLVENTFSLLGMDLTQWFGPTVAGWIIYATGTAVIAIFVIGGCNAVNLIDGLDGLAAGVTAISVIGFLAMAAIVALRGDAPGNQGVVDDPVRIVMCLAILGGILGFLPYNFNPATIFMGDAGSLLLGYLGVATILMFADVHLKHVTAALIIFAVPITDTAVALIRRKVRGQPLFSPDNGHIHHVLRRQGLSVKGAVGVLYLVQLCFASLGVAMIAFDLQWRYVLAFFVVMYGFVLVFAYKYASRAVLIEKLKQMEGAEPGKTRANAEDEAEAELARAQKKLPEAPTTDAEGHKQHGAMLRGETKSEATDANSAPASDAPSQ